MKQNSNWKWHAISQNSTEKWNILWLRQMTWKSFKHHWSFVSASKAKLWYFPWCQPEQAVEQILDKPIIWDALIPMLRHWYVTAMGSGICGALILNWMGAILQTTIQNASPRNVFLVLEVKWNLVRERFIMTRYYTWCDNNQCNVTRTAFQTLKSQTLRNFYEYFWENGHEDVRPLCIYNYIMTRYWIVGIFLSYLNRNWKTFSRLGPWGQHDHNWHTHVDQREIIKHPQLNQSFSGHFLKTSSVHGSWVDVTWTRHDMKTFSALLALCEGKPPPVYCPYQLPSINAELRWFLWTSCLTIRQVTGDLRH